MKRSAGPAIGD
jgi:hypothetical protein